MKSISRQLKSISYKAFKDIAKIKQKLEIQFWRQHENLNTSFPSFAKSISIAAAVTVAVTSAA
jgi:hypothetical protein